jgi:hypothetical protein
MAYPRVSEESQLTDPKQEEFFRRAADALTNAGWYEKVTLKYCERNVNYADPDHSGFGHWTHVVLRSETFLHKDTILALELTYADPDKEQPLVFEVYDSEHFARIADLLSPIASDVFDERRITFRFTEPPDILLFGC